MRLQKTVSSRNPGREKRFGTVLCVCAALTALCAAGARPPEARAEGQDGVFLEGLYLEKRGDVAGAYLKYTTLGISSPEASERIRKIFAGASGSKPVYGIFPFVSPAQYPEAGRRLAGGLEARFARKSRGGFLVKGLVKGGRRPLGLDTCSQAGALPADLGISKAIVGEVVEFTITRQDYQEEKSRTVNEPYETTRFETEEYQEVIEKPQTNSAVSGLAGEEANKAVKKKLGGGLFGKLAGAVAEDAAKKALQGPKTETVTKTRQVPKTVTEYRARKEYYSVAMRKKRVTMSVLYGIVDVETGAVEFKRQKTVSFDSSGSAQQAAPDSSLKAKASARMLSLVSAELAAQLKKARAPSLLRAKSYLASGQKPAAARECLLVLSRDRSNSEALAILRSLSENYNIAPAPAGN